MKVLMFPGRSSDQNNKYIDILATELRQNNIVVEDWNKYKPLQAADVFHIHWPELLIWLRNRRFRRLEGDFFIWNFFDTIRRVKRCNGVIVWTVHNLKPHEQHTEENALYEKVIEQFISLVDGFFVLTEAGVDEIFQSYPSLKSVPWTKTPHPSYEAVLKRCPLNMQRRTQYHLNERKWVCSLLGHLRPSKKADLAVDAFASLDSEKYHLILAGGITDSYKKTLNNKVRSCENISADYRVLSDDEISEYYSVSDVLVFPSQDYFNSGTIYTSLSLNIPVIASRTRTNEEIQKQVGREWLYLFDGEFNKEVVIDASRSIVSRIGNPQCDMSYFSPKKAAGAMVEGYKKILDIGKCGIVNG